MEIVVGVDLVCLLHLFLHILGVARQNWFFGDVQSSASLHQTFIFLQFLEIVKC